MSRDALAPGFFEFKGATTKTATQRKPRNVVLMFQARFARLIPSGKKLCTIRPPRKRPIRPGDSLSLRYWKDQPYRSKQILIQNEVCHNVQPIRIERDGITLGSGGMLSPADCLKWAKQDGFQSFAEMLGWFEAAHGLPFEGDVISW